LEGELVLVYTLFHGRNCLLHHLRPLLLWLFYGIVDRLLRNRLLRTLDLQTVDGGVLVIVVLFSLFLDLAGVGRAMLGGWL
jgi:hypothetical protein